MGLFSNPIKHIPTPHVPSPAEIAEKAKQAAEAAKKQAEEAKKLAEKAKQEAENTYEKNVPQDVKDGVKEGADFLVNSGDKDYWQKDLPQLRTDYENLVNEYNNKLNTYRTVRTRYAERRSKLQSMLEGNQRLGLGDYLPNDGFVQHQTSEFQADDYSEFEAGAQAAAKFLGVNQYWAMKEAEKEKDHLIGAIGKMKKTNKSIDDSIAKHEQGIKDIEQRMQEIFKFYGSGTNESNIFDRQNQYLANQQGNKAKLDIAQNLKNAGMSKAQIQGITKLSDAELASIGIS